MKGGIMLMSPQTRLLLLLRGASPPPCTALPSIRDRFISRAALDLVLVAPWVPIFSLLPGAVLLFSACASLAPRLLPSTFAVARARSGFAPPPRTPVSAAAAAAPPLVPRFAADAPLSEADVSVMLPADAAAALAVAVGLDGGPAGGASGSLARYNDGLLADDALLAAEEALCAGAFGEGRGAELWEAARARLLPLSAAAGEGEVRAALRDYLALRKASPPLALLSAMARATHTTKTPS